MNSDENINTIDTIDANNANNAIDAMVVFVNDLPTRTTASSARRDGRASPSASQDIPDSSSAQEGEGVLESGPKFLAQEKEDLIARHEWVAQKDVEYVKVSVFPQLNAQHRFEDYKCLYGLKLTNQDLRKHQYSSKLTHRHNDYLGYARGKWADADSWHYPAVAQAVKDSWRAGVPAYAGRSANNVGVRKTARRLPILAYTTILIDYNPDEDQWDCTLMHHDFKRTMSIPNWEWQQAREQWIKEYGIQKEFKKKTPPMIAFEWRNLL